MKTFMMVFALMMALAIRSEAWVYVTWGAGEGFYFSGNPNTGFLAANGSGSALAQLIWSANAVADPVTVGATHYLSGDDQWLMDVTLVNGVNTISSYGDFNLITYSDPDPLGHQNGYLYCRVLQDATPLAGELYYATTPVANGNVNPTNSPPSTAQNLEMNTTPGTLDGDPLSQVQLAVPEPGTLGLFSLGVMAISGRFLRRKQKK